jgi:hypothetical protein
VGYLGFLEDVCKQATGQGVDFWSMLQKIDESDLFQATMHFDLAIFSSAWNYKGGGEISNISEGSLTLKNYLSSLLQALAGQYVEVMRLFDPSHRMVRCIMSGGVARRLPVLHKLISRLSGYPTLPACELDESLIGLRTIALVSAGRAAGCLAGQEIYGRL